MSETQFESDQRNEALCLGCGRAKQEPGLVVCWDCFSRHPKAPFKYFEGSLSDWLKAIGRAQ